MAFTFQVADGKKSSDIVALYNDVTLQLHRKGIHQWEYPWRADIVKRAIERREVYIVEFNGIAVGAFLLGETSDFQGLRVEESSLYLSKIAILPSYQGLGIGKEIVSFACAFARTAGRAMYLDCWAGNEKLKEFYTGCGLNYMGDFPEEDYFISVFKSGR